MPDGTKFEVTTPGDYAAITPGQVLDSWHVTGNLVVAAEGVVIRNTQVDGIVGNGYSGPTSDRWFLIEDSTVGPAAGCISAMSAVSESNYTARRVHTRGVSDGFGITRYGTEKHSDVLIEDSFIELCGIAADHSDGVQAVVGGTNVVIRHNTIVELPCTKRATHGGPFPASWPCTDPAAQTAPIFISDGSLAVTAENNLLIGGSNSLRINYTGGGLYEATGNAVVRGAWQFAPVDNGNNACGHLGAWTRTNANGNRIVTVDANFQITAAVAPLLCAP